MPKLFQVSQDGLAHNLYAEAFLHHTQLLPFAFYMLFHFIFAFESFLFFNVNCSCFLDCFNLHHHPFHSFDFSNFSFLYCLSFLPHLSIIYHSTNHQLKYFHLHFHPQCFIIINLQDLYFIEIKDFIFEKSHPLYSENLKIKSIIMKNCLFDWK